MRNITFNEKANLPTLRQLREMLVVEALQRSENNRAIASKMIGISVEQFNEIHGKFEGSPGRE